MGEVQTGLLVTVWVLLSPEHTKELGPVILHIEGARHFGVAGQAKSQHLCRVAVSRLPMMYGNGSLSPLHRHAARHPTTIVVALQNFFAMTTKILLILPLERVAGRAQPFGKDFGVPAGTVHHNLKRLMHFRDQHHIVDRPPINLQY